MGKLEEHSVSNLQIHSAGGAESILIEISARTAHTPEMIAAWSSMANAMVALDLGGYYTYEALKEHVDGLEKSSSTLISEDALVELE
ncbi:hypothetical protein [Luteococcus japonicus]|uniref:hypothetical protein n=1 Tax=Luteococcus japonicus TaxID=33984 RepID=UPI00117DA22D|nr:hypothetical protein [Luteococcus japonicus]